ncbi:MAG: 3-deoxy-D-manno-octulosonic-acid transferase [Verrucomicrobiota bacterium]
MIRFLYNLLWPIGLLFFLPGYLVKMFRRGGYRNKFGQRFAFYDREVRARLSASPPIWLHAVSVGEVAIALKLARAITAVRAGARFVLTTTTTTGFASANKNILPAMEVIYTPLDFWPIMRKAFGAIRPERVVLVEAEVWPNLTAAARARRIPIALVSARLSGRSEERFRRFRWIVASTFRLLDLVCVQETRDIDRWVTLGVRRERIRHTGSIKYDPADRDSALKTATMRAFHLTPGNAGQLVLFGASTHRGEEAILARTFLALRKDFPQLTLFVVPRHVERIPQIRRQLESLSLQVKLCSEAEADGQSRPDCILLDKTGELQRWYGLATVVFVGKSLTVHGGQNPVEPIVAGKPVIFGPHMENFAALARELVANHAAIQVSDPAALEGAMAKLLGAPDARVRLVENARRVLDSHSGATARTAKLILDLK